MIHEMMKIAKVKSPEALLKKFPTEEAFMKKHGKEFQAKCGATVKAEFGIQDFFSIASQAGGMLGQAPQADYQMQGINMGQAGPSSSANIMPQPSKAGQIMQSFGGPLKDIGEGLSALKAERAAKKEAQQMAALSSVNLKSAQTRPEEIERRYVRPEDNPISNNMLFPTDGVGTNVLAQNGATINHLTGRTQLEQNKLNEIAYLKSLQYPKEYQGYQDIRTQYQKFDQEENDFGFGTKENPFARQRDSAKTAYNNLKFPIQGKNGIHIKEKNKGKFTASAKAMGHTVQEHAKHILADPNASALQKKRANFARNAAKWEHQEGGIVTDTIQRPKGLLDMIGSFPTVFNQFEREVDTTGLKEGKKSLNTTTRKLGQKTKYSGMIHPDQNVYEELRKKYYPEQYQQGGTATPNIAGIPGMPTYMSPGDNAIHPIAVNPMLSPEENQDRIDAYSRRMKITPDQYSAAQEWRTYNEDYRRRMQQETGEALKKWRKGTTGATPHSSYSIASKPYTEAWKQIELDWYKNNPREKNQVLQDYVESGPGGRQPAPSITLPIPKSNSDLASVEKFKGGGFTNWMNTMGGKRENSAGWGQAEAIGTKFASGITGNNAGGQVGGAIGGGIGSIFGPGGKMIGSTIGTLAGGLLNTNPRDMRKAQAKTDANIMGMAGIDFGQNMQSLYSDYAKYGTQVTEMQQGGDIQPLWGGSVEPLSNNQYTQDGETVMFKGNSHEESDRKGRTGIGVNYKGNKFEAQGGEPAMKIAQQGTNAKGLVVFGDLFITKAGSKLIGDPNASGKKIQNYVNNITKDENKLTSEVNKANERLKGLDPHTKSEQLHKTTQELIIKGVDMKLKKLAEYKENAAAFQESINQTAEELNLDPAALAKEKIQFAPLDNKEAKYGKTMYALNGIQTPKNITKAQAEEAVKKGQLVPVEGKPGVYVKKGQEGTSYTVPELVEEGTPDTTSTVPGSTSTGVSWEQGYENRNPEDKNLSFEEWKKKAEAWNAIHRQPEQTITVPGTPDVWQDVTTNIPGTPDEYFAIAPEAIKAFAPEQQNIVDPVTGKKKFNPIPLANLAAPYFRGTDAEPLSGMQLMGEMFALSQNKLEPVQAQGYRPELDVPYDISYQEMLNRNEQSFKQGQRMAQYNPAFQSSLLAGKYAADQSTLAEQFRQNQAMKAGVYNKNRATLNDAQLKNLQIFDNQYLRQEQAKANTKEVTQAALNSISDKYLKNKSEQRTLQTYENLYNYRFGKDYRAKNRNDLVDFEAMKEGANPNKRSNEGLPPGYEYIYNSDGTPRDIVPIRKEKSAEQPELAINKYGSLVKAFKNF